jgi:hypothetical protein
MESGQTAEFSPRDIFGQSLADDFPAPAPAALGFSAPKVVASRLRDIPTVTSAFPPSLFSRGQSGSTDHRQSSKAKAGHVFRGSLAGDVFLQAAAALC